MKFHSCCIWILDKVNVIGFLPRTISKHRIIVKVGYNLIIYSQNIRRFKKNLMLIQWIYILFKSILQNDFLSEH